ncbi:MAG TPA: endo-1,4-beta-xylanase [Polyangia bacterium]|nr:endo-1,4-beta-xylanase [Polyangia bacterium]
MSLRVLIAAGAIAVLAASCGQSGGGGQAGSGGTAGVTGSGAAGTGGTGGGSGATGSAGSGGGNSGAAGSGGSQGTGAAATGGAGTGGSGTGGASAGGNSGGGGASSAGTGGASARGGAGGSGTGGTSGRGGAGGTGGTGGSGGSGGSNAGGTGGTSARGGAGGTGGGAGYPMGGATPGLATKYADYFPIGAAINSTTMTSHAPLIKAHFNSMTTENEMKWDALEPTENSFSYGTADTLVNFAMTNKMKIRGHTLVWFSQNPSWVFSNGSGGMPTSDVLLARMKNHITKVMQHFAGKVYAWDVVNEAIMEDGSYRDGTLSSDKASLWYQIIGPTYIAEAFKAAHAADPNAKLFYNDYYDYIPAKQQGIYNMVKGLLDQGIQVDGIGMQCHINIAPSTDPTNQGYYQDVGHLEDAIKLYSSLGVAVQVTELDMSLYVPGVTYTSSQYYTTATFTDALKMQQADRYFQFFQLFRNYKNVITGVTFWGIADDATWLSMFSSGRKDFPLLFDVNHNPKPAFWAVVDF